MGKRMTLALTSASTQSHAELISFSESFSILWYVATLHELGWLEEKY